VTETVVNLPAVQPQRREVQNVIDPVPILDTARFEHMQRVARVMASSSMIPETLRTVGRGNDKEDLPFEQVLSNCFLVVNQAARWGMDPFSVISCCAVVHGRLAYEGKLVAAVLAAKLNISLNHYFTGDSGTDAYRIYLCDQPFTAELIAQLKPGVKIPGLRLWDGSVGEWKTTGVGTPWTPKNYPRMLIYRGTRDWTRIYESAILLGVYTDDELMDLAEDARARRATPVASSLAERLAAARIPGTTPTEGFSHDHVTRETGGQTQESVTNEGDAGHSEAPHDATRHEIANEVTENRAPDAHGQPDRVETVASTKVGGDDASLAGKSGQAGEMPATDSNSPETEPSPRPGSQVDEPAADVVPPSEAAGALSQSSAASPADDEAQAGVTRDAAGLPSGWAIAYSAALRRAQKKESLEKYAGQFWNQYGGWAAHKNGPDAATAVAVFDAFKINFGRPELIEAALRELI